MVFKIAQNWPPASRYRIGRWGDFMTQQRSEWERIAEAASTEMDPTKLMTLINELNRAFEKHDKPSQRAISVSKSPSQGRLGGPAVP